MTEYAEKYPNLKELLGLIHQDWDIMFEWEDRKPDYQAAIRKLKVSYSSEERQRSIIELKELISAKFDETLLRKLSTEVLVQRFTRQGLA